MKYSKYKEIASIAFPELNLNKMPSGTLTPPECVKYVARSLFIIKVIDGELAEETRRQLIFLQETGCHCFE
jgi:hypothetical protein